MKSKATSTQVSPSSLFFPELQEAISKDRPCGDDLEYDPEFVVLQVKAAAKSDAQYGDFVSAPEAVNWSDLERDCKRLLLRTRDVRILVLLVRCRVKLDHATGLRDGLSILAYLLTKWPDAIHPQLVVDGEPDPALRANALAALADPQGLLQDVRELTINGNGALRLQTRDVERSLGMPRPADSLAPDSVRQQLEDLRGQKNAALAALDEAMGFATSIDAWGRHHLQDNHPDLEPLLRLLELVTGAAKAAAMPEVVPEVAVRAVPSPPVPGQEGATDSPSTDDACDPIEMTTEPDAPMGRDAALAAICKARHWFETHEPSSPIPLLLKQAERLTGKRFDEIFQAIPADLVERWALDD
jgi:type VI secretion system protein ImpA